MIHSPGCLASVLKRTGNVIGLYYEPERDAQEKADAIDEFGKVLKDYPKWAVSAAFDNWTRTRTRRPSPAEIAILAEDALKPFYAEIKRRNPEEEPTNPVVSQDAAERICQQAGFTPKRLASLNRNPMATTFEEAETARPKNEHWSKTATPDDPRWKILQESRAKNPLMKGEHDDT